MIYKLTVDKQSRINPSNEKKVYEIDIDELHYKDDIYDTLTIEKDKAYVTRRLSLSKYHVLSVSEEPIIEDLGDLDVQLFEGDNYIYLEDMIGNKIFAEYLIKNDFTDLYVTTNEMNSAINQTADKIQFNVSQKLSGYSTIEEMNSLITQTAKEITSLITASIKSPNLLLNSDFSNNLDKWELTQTNEIVSSTVINNKNWLQVLNSEASDVMFTLKQIIKPFRPDMNYTFSSKVKITYLDEYSSTTMKVKLEFYDSDDNFISLVSNDIKIQNIKNEQTISTTFKTPNNNKISYAKLTIQSTPNHTDLLMTNLQLELGSVVTEWNTSQTDYYSQITQKVNLISSEVGKKVGNEEIISKINQSAEKIRNQSRKNKLISRGYIKFTGRQRNKFNK